MIVGWKASIPLWPPSKPSFSDKSLHVGVMVTDLSIHSHDCEWPGELRTETDFGPCLPEDGPRFVTNENLVEDLTCLLDMGDGGILWENPVSSAIIALSDEKAQPGECNEGFLREEAVLGIFFITNDTVDLDEDDEAHPDTDTSNWYTDLLAAKDGDMSAMVAVGVLAQEPSSCFAPYGPENTNLIELIDQFGMWGHRSSICEPDLGPALEAGVELLADTCAVWVP